MKLAAFDDHEAVSAGLPWDKSYLTQGYYRVFRWKTGWAAQRPHNPLLENFDRVFDTIDEAKAACVADFVEVDRIHAWLQFIKSHDPPLVSYVGLYVVGGIPITGDN
jgi:hypothetical protein